MISDVKEIIEFLGEHEMTPSQFLFCWILYLDKEEYEGETLPTEGKAIANIYRYIELVGRWDYEEIDDLVERGYVHGQENNEGFYYPDQMKVTEKFSEAVFATMEDFDKFLQEYPSFTDNFQDPRKADIPLKAVDMEKVERIFKQKVKSKSEFKKLMKSLRWAKERDKINMNILNYISGEIWKAHLKKMKKDPPNVEHKTMN